MGIQVHEWASGSQVHVVEQQCQSGVLENIAEITGVKTVTIGQNHGDAGMTVARRGDAVSVDYKW